MSRAAFYDALVADSELVALGINDNTVFHNYSSLERPSDSTPFIIIRWNSTDKPLWQSVEAPLQATLWIHWPAELSNDFTDLIAIMDRIDDMVKELRDVPGSDGRTLSFVQIGGRSGDLLDDGFNTITKNASYEIYSRRSQ